MRNEDDLNVQTWDIRRLNILLLRFHLSAPDRGGNCSGIFFLTVAAASSSRCNSIAPKKKRQARLFATMQLCVHHVRVMHSFSKCTDAWVLITARGAGAYRGRHGGISCPRQVVDLADLPILRSLASTLRFRSFLSFNLEMFGTSCREKGVWHL